MKYILMMHGQKCSWDEYARWSKEDLQRNVEFMRNAGGSRPQGPV
jgi:hypothetical protein